jgi:Protein of unknown function (DUF1552)
MFITKKHIPRRTFLKGAGVTLALPLLGAMVPARAGLRQTAALYPPRFMGIFYPHGMAYGFWEPENVGALPETLPRIMEPLKRVQKKSVIFTGLWSKSAEPPEGTTGSDHWVAAAFLTAIKPKKTSAADASVGSATIDQVIAQKIGTESLLPSLQLAVEDPGTSSSTCGEGYSCAYTNSISWVELETPAMESWTRTSPLPMELDPQRVFERLFGSGATPEVRAARARQSKSILDGLLGELSSLGSDVGGSDRAVIDQYTTEVREIERRLQLAQNKAADIPTVDEPSGGIPDNFDEHAKLHMDLTALAFQADITRVVTFLGARDLTGRSYPFPRGEWFPDGGQSVSFHGGSHHQDRPAALAQYAELNRYHMSMTAYMGEKLDAIPEGDGTVLDHSLVLHGTNMGNSNQHQHYDVAHVMMGGANGHLRGNRHIAYPRKEVTTGNLLLSVMDMYGIHKESQGDSTGRLQEL